ncbi:O-methyltransferase [Actinoplanes subglobosus]|uniref:O-methyltransferase n=1 Tax=Actinoplanes subglobosus TaxID=1547892 RepID=A0ABV8J5I8_9ACTN
MSVPELVAQAQRRAARLGFGMSCEDPVGPLLAVLAAGVPEGGRILELGTGTGTGTAWLASGLTGRTDATLTTVELDPGLVAAFRESTWPAWAEIIEGDAAALLPHLGHFDLIFADAVAGKWTDLALTLDALAPGGVLVVDDMDLSRYTDPAHRAAVRQVEDTLATDPRLLTVHIPAGTAITLATRRR